MSSGTIQLVRGMAAKTTQAWVYLADSRTMAETPSETIALVVTSPPYWHIKDYGVPHQIGYGQSLHEYLYDLSRVWKECWRVLQPGHRLAVADSEWVVDAHMPFRLLAPLPRACGVGLANGMLRSDGRHLDNLPSNQFHAQVVEQPQPCELLELVGREAVALHACKWGVRRASGAPACLSDGTCSHSITL